MYRIIPKIVAKRPLIKPLAYTYVNFLKEARFHSYHMRSTRSTPIWSSLSGSVGLRTLTSSTNGNQKPPTDEKIEALLKQAGDLIQQDHLAEAKVVFENLLDINQNHFFAQSQLGLILHSEGKFDEAIEKFQRSLQINPDYYIAYNNIGLVLASKGEIHSAMSNYTKAIEMAEANGTPDPVPYVNRASIQLRLNNKDAFRSNLLHAGLSHFMLAEIHMKEVKKNAAKNELRHVLNIFRGLLSFTHIEINSEVVADTYIEINPEESIKLLGMNKSILELATSCAAICLELGDIDNAIEFSTHAIRIKPSAHTIFLRGNLYCVQKKFHKAVDDLTMANELKPNDVKIMTLLSAALFDADEYARTVQVCKKILNVNPADLELLTRLGCAQGRLGHFDEAIKILTGVLETDSSQTQAFFDRGYAYRHKAMLPEALDDFVCYLKKHPDSTLALWYCGIIYVEIKKFDEAISDFKAALKLEPGMPHVLVGLGNLYKKLGRFQEALECYSSFTTLEEEGRYTDAIKTFYSASVHKNRVDVQRMLDADSKEEDILQQETQAPSLKVGYELIMKSGDIDGGLEVLDNILGKNIQDQSQTIQGQSLGWVYGLKGYALQEKRKLKEAIATFDKALQLTEDLDVLINRSFCYLHTQRYKECIEDCERVLARDPKMLSAQNNLISAAGHLTDREQALKSLNAFLELHPNVPIALLTRSAIHFHMDNYNKQVEDISLALMLDPQLAKFLKGKTPESVAFKIILPPPSLHPGLMLFEQKKFTDAIDPLIELLKIRVEALGLTHKLVGDANSMLGFSYQKLGDTDKSIKYFEEAHKIYIANREKESSNAPLTDFFSKSETDLTDSTKSAELDDTLGPKKKK